MKTNNNEIIHDMHTEDLMQVKNYDKIGFEVGSIREDHETFRCIQFGKSYYYIKSAGIYFPISKDSAETIIAKIERLSEIKKDIEKINVRDLEEKRIQKNKIEMMKSKESEDVKRTEWIFRKIDAHRGCVISIPNDAICIMHSCVGEYDYISWLEPHKK